MMPGPGEKEQEREALRAVIQQWNANRLDLFELSEPNEDLLFHGVMRFYFHDSSHHVTTKCIRVASDATVTAVIETLIEKFRPDMRMLSVPEYALYVTHENGDERRLNPDEKPLLVQLNWHKDDREGRFLLKRIGEDIEIPAKNLEESSFKRKLSKREKKELKKQEKLKRVQSSEGADGKVAEKLYTELPETSFTRSISNPEAVMRRRRQQKLERKLQQFRSKDGGPDTGGTLKIYGEALCGDVPYKTLLLSVNDTAAHVLKEMLLKYGRDSEDVSQYCLVQVNSTDQSETILDEDDCPLAILMNHSSTNVRKGVIMGSIMFHVRRRPADYHPRKRKKKPQQKWQQSDMRYEDSLPYFLELNPDGSEILSGQPRRHILPPNVTEVGSERTDLQLFGPNVQPRHCVIAHTDGLVTVTPCSRDAEVFVNGQRIYETSILQHGAIVKFGRIHNFRFIDPAFDDRTRGRHPEIPYDRLSRDDNNSTSTGVHNWTSNTSNYETTFDVDGNVETVSLKDLDARSQRSIASSRDGNRLSNNDRFPRGNDPILPAVLEVREETEEPFLQAVILDLDHLHLTFKLAPTYVLYLMARYRASTHYRPELTPNERAHRLTSLLARVANMIRHVVEERCTDPSSLAFWMANSAELLHFLKSDRHISAFSLDAQDILADCVQTAFRQLVSCTQRELSAGMSSFLCDSATNAEVDIDSDAILTTLCKAMALLRLCRVNAALTIQFFSHMFYFINMLAFNRIVTSPSPQHPVNYRSRAWGTRIKSRVAQLAAWAERQGLELAANCHLGRLAEAAYLLEAPKYTVNDLAALSSTCLKLNSIQLRALLRGYQPAPDEPRLPVELIDNVVRVAENVADELARSDGREVTLEEPAELQLSFLLPEDGFSCDVVRGLHHGLLEFVQQLHANGFCRMAVQPTSSGLWTIYMTSYNANNLAATSAASSATDPNSTLRSPSAMSNRMSSGQAPLEVQTIRLHKSNNGMGLSIVAAKGAGQDRLGIYIKSVVPGGAADVDGRLQAGDQLLKVDGHSLVGITQEKAAEYLVRTGPIVQLEVAKQGAIYHGLATLLSQPSPLMARARRNSDHFPVRTVPHDKCNWLMQTSRSVGNLGHFCNNSDETGLAKGLKTQVTYNRQNSGSSHASDDPAQSTIFSKIDIIDFGKRHNSNQRLSKEEVEKCVNELKAIVADFEKCTQNLPDDDGLKFNLDLTDVDSNNDSDLSLISPLHDKYSPTHVSLSRKKSNFRNCSNTRDNCRHDHLKLLAPGKVATLARYFSSLGSAGLIRCKSVNPTSKNDMKNLWTSTPDLADNCTQVSIDDISSNQIYGSMPNIIESSTQTSARCNDNEKPCYDYSLVVSLLKAEKKKFPKDFLVRRSRSTHELNTLSRPRRMSERDLPGRIQSEQERRNPAPQLQITSRVPHIQSSKSVPSLNSGIQTGQQEVFNPGYSRASSSTSIPHTPLTYRSNLNLTNDVRGLHPAQSTPSLQHYPANQQNNSYHKPGPGTTSTPNINSSIPSLASPNNYNSHQNSTSSAGNFNQPNINRIGYQQSPPNKSYPPTNNQSAFPPSTNPSYSNANQVMSNHVGYQHNLLNSQQNNYGPPHQYPSDNHLHVSPPGNFSQVDSPRSPTSPNAFHKQPNTSLGPHSPNQQLTGHTYESERFYQNVTGQDGIQRGKMPSMQDIPSYMQQQHQQPRAAGDFRERPSSAYYPQAPSYPQQPQQYPPVLSNTARSQSSRDMLRQEAKLLEMTEEVRRRELRGAGGNIGAGPPSANQSSPSRGSGPMPSRPGVSFAEPPDRDSPPPPPPPPANTHPLLQKSPTQVDGRYQASLGSPPRGGFYPTTSTRSYPYTGTNPWEREEREKEAQRRREAARRWRETQIAELSRVPQRTPQQEEQLRALHLEREFERRAAEEEAAGAGGDDDEGEEGVVVGAAEERVQGLLKMAQVQNGPIIKPAQQTIAQMRLEDVRRQHAAGLTLNLSLNKTSPATARQTNQNQSSTLTSPNQLRMDQLTLGPSSPSQPHPHMQQQQQHYNNYQQQHQHPHQAPVITHYNGYSEKTNLSAVPMPPERGSSFNANTLQQQSPSVANTKRVSFSDNRTPPNNISNTRTVHQMDKISEDPNNFINEAESLLQSPTSPDGNQSLGQGATPGVIGSQEVYRDPRQRLLAEQKQNSAPRVPGPEKLSFKEKMKMFAMETGEENTPRDKVKISRAQRDIDNINTPVSNNNNNNNNNSSLNNN